MIKSIIKKIRKIPRAIIRRIIIFRERLSGLDFTQSISLEELGLESELARSYVPSSKYDLRRIFKQLNIQPSDNILDYGSGKGVAMFIMSEFNFKQIGGVEISQPLTEICKRNLTKLGITNTIVFNCNAIDFKELDDYNYFYFFNPFPGIVLEQVLNNIVASCYEKARKITLIYYNPGHRYAFDKNPFFRMVGGFKGREFDVLFYTNSDKNP